MKYFILFSFLLSALAGEDIGNNLKLGIPSDQGQIINREGYAFCYSEKHEQPLWVVYQLTKDEVLSKVAKRKDNFRKDPLIKTGSAALADYKGSGYDRGHLAPAADMAWSEKAMSDSFYLSNMSPQVPGLNRGMWKDLESLVRHWAVTNDSLYVYTGALIRPGYKSLGVNQVTIPQWYYKVVVDIHPPETKAIAFIMPNRKPQKGLQEFVVTIDKLEAVTGLDFLSSINDELESKLESSYDLSKWSFTNKDYSAWVKKEIKKDQEVKHIGVLYWITSNSNKRHNPNCRYYKKAAGYTSEVKEGVACKICGG
jgi:DNA/RNA endonuclease G (NUC1)